MISESDARAKILESVRPLPPRKISISEALDRFAAQDYLAQLPLPMFDNSAMDGYAVIASDCKKAKRLRVVGEQPAGVDRNLRVSNGEAIRIFTGAPMPVGADAVAMQEDIEREGDEIVLNADVDLGDFVRKRGCDLGEGQKILSKGERIVESKVALLASQGLAEVSIGGEVRAAIISTGDELAQPGEKLQPGQIYDSNAILLQALIRRCGATVAMSARCPDQAGSLEKEFQAAARNEIMIVTGGVSVGEHDLVQAGLRKLGAKIDIWRVAIKPGKPFLFGTLGSCHVFGLPGNPVSAFVTFLHFVRPAVLKMMGANDIDLATLPAKLTIDQNNDGERPHYVRGKFEKGNFTPIGRQESHALFGLSESNALLRIEIGESFKAGQTVFVQTWP
jgi:molybdenum cofactor synthesis domain